MLHSLDVSAEESNAATHWQDKVDTEAVKDMGKGQVAKIHIVFAWLDNPSHTKDRTNGSNEVLVGENDTLGFSTCAWSVADCELVIEFVFGCIDGLESLEVLNELVVGHHNNVQSLSLLAKLLVLWVIKTNEGFEVVILAFDCVKDEKEALQGSKDGGHPCLFKD
jgi:hypothetical protein